MNAAQDEARSVRLRARMNGGSLGEADEAPSVVSQAGTAAVRVALWSIPIAGGYVAYRKSGSVLVGAMAGIGVAVVETVAVLAFAYSETGKNL